LNPLKDVTGQTFGRLTAVRYVPKRGFECVCTCGVTAVVVSFNLRSGRTRSCGCLRTEALTSRRGQPRRRIEEMSE
jgi:hypothetical protein